MESHLPYIGLTQALFAAFIVITKLRTKPSQYLLFAWLLVIAVKFGALIWWHDMPVLDPRFGNALLPFTYGPFLFLYTKYLIYEPRFKPRDLVHFAPFVIIAVLYLALFRRIDAVAFTAARIVHGALYSVSVLYYSGMTIYLVLRYRRHVRDHFSYLTIRNKLLWIYFVTGLFGTVFTLNFVLGVVTLLRQDPAFDMGLVSDVGLVLLTFATAYFGVRQPTLKEHEVPTVEDEEDITEDEPAEKRTKNVLTAEEARGLEERLRTCMEAERPHLNPELTVLELAREIGVPRHHLTELLNEHLGMNFFHFVNEYRVAEVQQRLIDPACAHLTIVAIAFESGFNSKSSFNSIFKQSTGQTPSAWKKEALNRERADASL